MTRQGTGLLIAAMLTLFIMNESSAQVQFSRKYRVVALKEGNPSVQSVSNEVEVIPQLAFYVPNSFTPNGDGLNDTFGISGEAVHELSLQVFNRWGQLIFETKNPKQRWDGTFQGEKAPVGSYAYRIVAKGVKGNQIQREGHLNLIL